MLPKVTTKKKQEFEVGKIAFINFGCKELANQE